MSPGPPPEELHVADGCDWDIDIEVLRRRRERFLTAVAIFAIIAASGALAYYMVRPVPVDQRLVVRAANDAVRDAFGTGFAYVFGDVPQVTREEEDGYLIRSEVLVVNRNGASAHWWFDCEVHRSWDGRWLPAKLTLMPY